jgi:hypothetical protein
MVMGCFYVIMGIITALIFLTQLVLIRGYYKKNFKFIRFSRVSLYCLTVVVFVIMLVDDLKFNDRKGDLDIFHHLSPVFGG